MLRPAALNITLIKAMHRVNRVGYGFVVSSCKFHLRIVLA